VEDEQEVTMTRKALPVPYSLDRVRRRFEGWRGSREPRARIPETLWAAAVELARERGVNRTARTLHLDYYSLKKRLKRAGRIDGTPAEVAPKFLELVASPAGSGDFSECMVEFDDGRGAKMRVQLRGAHAPDLAALSRTFWDGGK